MRRRDERRSRSPRRRSRTRSRSRSHSSSSSSRSRSPRKGGKGRRRKHSRSSSASSVGGRPLTYKEFVERLPADITPKDAQERFEKYQHEYGKTEEHLFYERHKKEEWFREWYDPLTREELRKQKAEGAASRQEEFLQSVRDRTLLEVDQNCEDKIATDKDAPKDPKDPETNDTHTTVSEPSEHTGASTADNDGATTTDNDGDVKMDSANTTTPDAKKNGETPGEDAPKKESTEDSAPDSGKQEDDATMEDADKKPKEADDADKKPKEADDADKKPKEADDADKKPKEADDADMKPEEPVKGEYTGPQATKKNAKFHINSIFLSGFPLSVTRAQLREVFQDAPGYKGLTLTNPVRGSRHQRYGWVRFDSQEACEKAIQDTATGGLNGTKIPQSNHFLALRPRMKSRRSANTAPPISLHPRAIKQDITNCCKLISKFDKELELSSPFLVEDDSALDLNSDVFDWIAEEPLRQLNILQAYLRQVHFSCYYSGKIFLGMEHVLVQVGPVYERLRGPASSEAEDDLTAWEKEIAEKVKTLQELTPDKPWDAMAEEKLNEWMESNTFKVADGKFRCAVCKKLFRAPKFVWKHIANKHSELVEDKRAKMADTIAFDAYRNDKDHITERWFDTNNRPQSGRGRGTQDRSRRPPRPNNNFYGAPRERRRVPQHYAVSSFQRTMRSYRDVDFMPEEDTDEIDYGFGDYVKPPKFNL